jgi:uncharacterized protein YqeY
LLKKPWFAGVFWWARRHRPAAVFPYSEQEWYNNPKKETKMTIIDQLTEDMKTAMKAAETERLNTVRLLRGAMKNEEIKLGHPLSDDEAMKVLQREAKQRRDSIEQYRGAGRDDLATKEEAELAIVQTYLPQPLSEAELTALVGEAIARVGATDMKQMGAVVGAVMGQVGARAEGGAVSKLVREKLGAA